MKRATYRWKIFTQYRNGDDQFECSGKTKAKGYKAQMTVAMSYKYPFKVKLEIIKIEP